MVNAEGKFESILEDEDAMILVNRLMSYGYDVDDIEEAMQYYEESE